MSVPEGPCETWRWRDVKVAHDVLKATVTFDRTDPSAHGAVPSRVLIEVMDLASGRLAIAIDSTYHLTSSFQLRIWRPVLQGASYRLEVSFRRLENREVLLSGVLAAGEQTLVETEAVFQGLILFRG